VALGVLVSFCLSGLALGKDQDDDEAEAPTKPALPNLYLDMRTIYATLPAGSLSIGVSAPPSQTGTDHWTAFSIYAFTVGFQADIYQQNGGMFPTITIQSNATRSISDAPLATTSYNTILEADYALNTDETRGLLAGMQYARVFVDTPLARVSPDVMGYVGGYYQWDNNWKLTGRFGVQSFGGAQLLNLTPFPAFTQPIVRFDLDRMDDDDNRLFGITAQIAWTPKPSYQLTLRTPLYAIKN
jgi:hypothetical protein